MTGDTGTTTYTYNVNTLDRVGRYLMVSFQDTGHRAGGTTARDHILLDIADSVWFEVNGEKLLTKIETPVDPLIKYQMRAQHFKELKNYVPGEIYFLPLGIDGDVHNPGGGVINIRPFYNNLKLNVKISHCKRVFGKGIALQRQIEPEDLREGFRRFLVQKQDDAQRKQEEAARIAHLYS